MNTSRRLPDLDDKIFIPRNVDGGIGEEHFLTGPKLFLMGLTLVMMGYFIISLWGLPAYIMFKIVCTLLILYVGTAIIRYGVLNERYYYAMYKKMKNYQISSPASFWSIASKQEYPEGCVVTYSDTKTGVFLRLNRDSIIGKADNFKEQHYDAVSEFYREILKSGLKFVKLDIMEPAGKDTRMAELDDLVVKSKCNTNLYNLVQLQVAYIKQRAKATAYESEYILIYHDSLDVATSLIETVSEITQVLFQSGYSNVSFLTGEEIDDLVKEMYGVRLFDSNDAIINIFQNVSANKPAFTLDYITYTNGETKPFALDDLGDIDTPLAQQIRQNLMAEKQKELQEQKMQERLAQRALSKQTTPNKLVKTQDVTLSDTVLEMYDLDIDKDSLKITELDEEIVQQPTVKLDADRLSKNKATEPTEGKMRPCPVVVELDLKTGATKVVDTLPEHVDLNKYSITNNGADSEDTPIEIEIDMGDNTTADDEEEYIDI